MAKSRELDQAGIDKERFVAKLAAEGGSKYLDLDSSKRLGSNPRHSSRISEAGILPTGSAGQHTSYRRNCKAEGRGESGQHGVATAERESTLSRRS